MSDTDLERPPAIGLSHEARAARTIFASPGGDAGEFNTLGERLVPKGCFKVEDLLFEFDSSFIRPEIKAHLPKLVQLRNQHKEGDAFPPLTIFGHADPVGKDEYNKKLSGRRAIAFYAMLVRDTDLWEKLFSEEEGGDKWGTRSIQIMVSEVQTPVTVNGKSSDETKSAIKEFQGANGLKPDGDAGPKTRKA